MARMCVELRIYCMYEWLMELLAPIRQSGAAIDRSPSSAHFLLLPEDVNVLGDGEDLRVCTPLPCSYTANSTASIDGADPCSPGSLALLHTLDLAFLDLLFSLSSCISKGSLSKLPLLES